MSEHGSGAATHIHELCELVGELLLFGRAFSDGVVVALGEVVPVVVRDLLGGVRLVVLFGFCLYGGFFAGLGRFIV